MKPRALLLNRGPRSRRLTLTNGRCRSPVVPGYPYPAVRRGTRVPSSGPRRGRAAASRACGCGGVVTRSRRAHGCVRASPPARCRSGRCTPLARLHRFHQCQPKGERAGSLRVGGGLVARVVRDPIRAQRARVGEQARKRRVPTLGRPHRLERTGPATAAA
jgi:hypothetical protein